MPPPFFVCNKYVLTYEDGQFAFYDPEFPEIIYRDNSILVDDVNTKLVFQ
jgi:hypothetical protein